MSQPIRIESVDQTMLERSIRTGVKYEFAEMELMITGLIQKYKKYQSDYSNYLKDIAMSQKDDKIDELKTMIQDQSKEIKNQSAQLSELLGYAKDTKESLQVANENIVDLQDTLEVTREEVIENRTRVIETHLKVVKTTKVVEEIDEMLRSKSITSTMNPQAEEYVHHALVVVKSFGRDRKIVLRSGQSAYIDTCKRKLAADGFEILFDKFYQANGIDYRRNVQAAVLESIEQILAPYNEPIIQLRKSLMTEIETHNASLSDDIDRHNSALIASVNDHNATAIGNARIQLSASKTFYRWKGIRVYGKLRSYEKECRGYEKEVRNAQYQLLTVDIDVNSKTIYWKPNEYVSYDSLVGMIEDVNIQTQSSPRRG